ncbi:caspase domain containing protein [Nitzschia inconspicua]|uniref:Caspase domain containing protein n=1 Tax=Nitzschia inconspicua TaxID=303405 RepID=A0A9K3Q079_9STRA|nr:caspase domain containing protein [Nitzschia inconspicua]KAG7365650.1 caspase domain containing protein [Nitzschia inconspicua]
MWSTSAPTNKKKTDNSNWTCRVTDIMGMDGCCVATTDVPSYDEESPPQKEISNAVAANKNMNNNTFFDEAKAKVQAMIFHNKHSTEIPVVGSTVASPKALERSPTANTKNHQVEVVKEVDVVKEANTNGGMVTDSDTDEDDEFIQTSNGTKQDIRASIIMISGCEDAQTSADVSNVSSFSLPDPNGRAGGACTSALLKVLHSSNTTMTFVQVLQKMRRVLSKGKYTQVPQLTSSHPVDLDQDFYIVPPDCTGTRRAVLIGINYEGQEGQLSGCHNDCMNIKEYLMDTWGFSESDIIILMDDGYHTAPTRFNILDAYRSVASESKSGDAVFCHYSGHGGRVRDDDWGEETDGYDETMVPVDYKNAGQIRDDDLYETLVRPMAKGVTVVSLMDCCHSETVLDLPYKYGINASSKGNRTQFCGWKLCCINLLLLIAIIVVAVLFLTGSF